MSRDVRCLRLFLLPNLENAELKIDLFSVLNFEMQAWVRNFAVRWSVKFCTVWLGPRVR